MRLYIVRDDYDCWISKDFKITMLYQSFSGTWITKGDSIKDAVIFCEWDFERLLGIKLNDCEYCEVDLNIVE